MDAPASLALTVQYQQDALKDIEDTVVECPLAEPLEALRIRYVNALRRGFQDHVHYFFPAAQMTLLGREYQPPRFWMVETQDHAPATAATKDGAAAQQHELLDKLLSVAQPETTGLAVGDIDAPAVDSRAGPYRARMFRRFIPNSRGTHDRPVHLVLPRSPSAIDLEHLQSVIEPLSDLEGDAATQLFEIVTDIDMYRSQLNLYERVAIQGSALWDQAVLFLPVARGHQLSRVHRIIELIYLVLLQGIADLEEEAANAQHAIERIEVVAFDLRSRFDRVFTEVPVPDRLEIRNSLAEAGYFDQGRRAARSVYEQSRQVRSTYKALLEGITYAFEERRVRETDVLQLVGLAFAIVLGLVSAWNEFLARYISNWQTGRWVVIGGLGIVLAAAGIWFMPRISSRLTSNTFKKRFEGELQRLLTAYSSDRLDRLRAADRRDALNGLAGDEESSTTTTKWRTLDGMLAMETAKFLDSLPELPSREPNWMNELPRRDIGDLRNRVQAWAQRALLATERPRRFYRSPLPRLTFLYRFFPILNGKPQQESDWSEADSQVSDSDFMFTVDQCGGDPEHVPVLNHWGHRQVRECQNAVEFVKQLEKVSLVGHMTSEEFCAMMQTMNELGGPLEGRGSFLRSQAVARLEEAKTLSRGSHYEAACGRSWTSARTGLTGFLTYTGADVSADPNDLLWLGIQARKRTGGPPSAEFQEAIWRLSAYREAPLVEQVTLRDYGESDAEKALSDAEVVLKQVDKWIGQGTRSSQDPARP